uniref:Putative salivary protein with polylysine tail n=1 Tax=Ixodes scapularis TaxID=6945 RepID=Q4PMI2_IXOSC|nr:putative salivary protein with polylysine tail [Ixodes scapularis]
MQAAVLTWALVGLFFVQEASTKCPDIKRRQQDTNCNYYCPNQAGDGWDEGFLLDGETCNAATRSRRTRGHQTVAANSRGQKCLRLSLALFWIPPEYLAENDGVCREGKCYQVIVPSPTEPSHPEDHPESPRTPVAPQPPKKKKKKSFIRKAKKTKTSKDKKSEKEK